MSLRIFKATFRDISRNNRFLVWLPGMPVDLVAHCINVNMPGETYSTNVNYDPVIGDNVLPWELPYDITQNECNMTFMVDQAYRIKSFFDRWRDEVFDPVRGFGYMEDYAKDVKIFQLTRQHIPSYTVTLLQAWPKTITDINFDAGNANGMTTFGVNLVYGGQRKTDTLGWVMGKLGIPRPGFI
jgi:hypothetical protein